MKLDSLTKKWHGLPVWAWALISALILYLLWTFLRNRSNSGTKTASNPQDSSTQDSAIQPDTGSFGTGSILFPTNGTDPFDFSGSSVGGNTIGEVNGADTANNVADQPASQAVTNTVTTTSAPSPKPLVQETTGNVGEIARGDVTAIPPLPDPVEQALQGQHPGVKVTKKVIPTTVPPNVHKPGVQI